MKDVLTKSSRLPVHNQLIGFSLIISAGICAFLIFFYLSFTNSLEDEKKTQTRYLSNSGMGVIRYFYQLSLSGEITSSDAQRHAMNALAGATYGNNGYFWINNGGAELVMQPYTPEKVGVNFIDVVDVNGKYLFREFVEEAKQGGGWVTYHWPKPGTQKDYPKISYVAYFAPWDWILGTGVYVDDMQSDIFWVVTKASGILFVSFIIFVVAAIFVVNYFATQLSNLAVRDGLTNLYTKRFLNEILPSILRKHDRLGKGLLAVTFMDVDFFKNVNDKYGHDWGDRVLKQVANVMMQNTRPDDYCIRYGGEEFVLIGIYDDKSSIVEVAERVRIEVSNLLFSDNNVNFAVTLSAGIAVYAGTNETFEETLKHADQKLYQSKESGRNCVSI